MRLSTWISAESRNEDTDAERIRIILMQDFRFRLNVAGEIDEEFYLAFILFRV